MRPNRVVKRGRALHGRIRDRPTCLNKAFRNLERIPPEQSRAYSLHCDRILCASYAGSSYIQLPSTCSNDTQARTTRSFTIAVDSTFSTLFDSVDVD